MFGEAHESESLPPPPPPEEECESNERPRNRDPSYIK